MLFKQPALKQPSILSNLPRACPFNLAAHLQHALQHAVAVGAVLDPPQPIVLYESVQICVSSVCNGLLRLGPAARVRARWCL